MVHNLSVGEFAFWLGDGEVEGAGGFDPLGDDGCVGCFQGCGNVWRLGSFWNLARLELGLVVGKARVV